MSYREALVAAGAVVIDYKEFGSYQGDWFAIIVHNGVKGIVKGSFGSCGGCDAFEGEFNYTDDSTPEEHQKRLKAFGEGYLDMITIEEAVTYAEKNTSWDLEAAEMVSWLKNLQQLEFAAKLESIVGGV